MLWLAEKLKGKHIDASVLTIDLTIDQLVCQMNTGANVTTFYTDRH